VAVCFEGVHATKKLVYPGSPLRYSPCTDKPPAASASVPTESLLPLSFQTIIFFVSSLSVHGCSDKLPDEEAAGGIYTYTGKARYLLGTCMGRGRMGT
jgi:hypothetical protein